VKTAKSEPFTVFVTKYALSKGIIEAQVETTSFDGTVQIVGKQIHLFHGEGKDWHRTLEGAQDRVYTMKEARMRALQHAVHKLSKLDVTTMVPVLWENV